MSTLHDRIRAVVEPSRVRDEPPYAAITQIGRWTYGIVIHHGISVIGPSGYSWHVLGRKRAERKARKVLTEYQLLRARLANRWRVEVEG